MYVLILSYSDILIFLSCDMLYVHLSFLFTAMLIHGVAPRDFMLSSILPVPKNKLVSVSNSENYRGMALSSILGKILDHLLLCKYSDKLCTSEQQFGFKRQSSTNTCTLVLKETLSYYVNNRSICLLFFFGCK